MKKIVLLTRKKHFFDIYSEDEFAKMRECLASQYRVECRQYIEDEGVEIWTSQCGFSELMQASLALSHSKF